MLGAGSAANSGFAPRWLLRFDRWKFMLINKIARHRWAEEAIIVDLEHRIIDNGGFVPEDRRKAIGSAAGFRYRARACARHDVKATDTSRWGAEGGDVKSQFVRLFIGMQATLA
jgi:hypothetical protein